MKHKERRKARSTRLPAWLRYGDWPIFYKVLGGGVLLVAVSLISVILISSSLLGDELRQMVGSMIQDAAGAEMEHVGRILDAELTSLTGLVVNDELISQLSKANDRYGGEQGLIQASIEAYERVWHDSSTEASLVQQIVDPQQNALTKLLLEYQHNLSDYGEIIVTDRYGVVVAATARPANYSYADEEWWGAAYNGGVGAAFIGQPQYDPATGLMKLRLAIPVYSSEDHNVLGVLSATLEDLRLLHTPQGSLHFTLTDDQGWILADTNNLRIGLLVPEEWMLPRYMFRKGGIETTDENGEPILLGAGLSAHVALPHNAADAAFRKLHWRLFVYQPLEDAYIPVQRTLNFGVWLVLLFIVLGAGGAYFLARSLTTPIVHLEDVARRMTAGDIAARAWVYRQDELGRLAQSLNTLFEHFTELLDSMEQQVKDRTLASELRSEDLETVAEIGRRASELLDADKLIRQVVIMVQERFDLYYVQFYLIDEARQMLILQEGVGKVVNPPSQKQLAVGAGPIGKCAELHKWQVATEPSELASYRSALPEARAFAAIPLRSRGRVLGVLVLYSRVLSAFERQRLTILQALADQVATSLDNARLYEESQFLLQRARRAYGEMGRAAWTELLNSLAVSGRLFYQADAGGVSSRSLDSSEMWDELLHQLSQTSRSGGTSVAQLAQEDGYILSLPVVVLGEPIGVLSVTRASGAGDWQQDEISVLKTLAERLGSALESARLYQNTQLRAAREQIVAELAARMRETLDVNMILNVAVQEIGTRLGLQAVDVRLDVGEESVTASSPLQQEVLDE